MLSLYHKLSQYIQSAHQLHQQFTEIKTIPFRIDALDLKQQLSTCNALNTAPLFNEWNLPFRSWLSAGAVIHIV